MAGVVAAITSNSRVCLFISPCCILDARVISNIQLVSQIPVIYQSVKSIHFIRISSLLCKNNLRHPKNKETEAQDPHYKATTKHTQEGIVREGLHRLQNS
uniref:Uncharacterized protein n=1 Tax=Populus davidiana TaxID=266767 RepID=A0A6M2F1K7_9ROSI